MANNALIQTGLNLAKSTDTNQGIGDAFRQGAALIDDQIRQNRRDRNEQEDREWLQKRRADQEELFKLGMEKKLMQYNEDKAAIYAEIDGAIERGDLSGPDYDAYKQNRDKWWKDSANQIKAQKDLVKVREKVKQVGAAEKNWPNILEMSKGVTISDSSPEAQKMDMAIDRWSEKNGGTPPPVVNHGGKFYFEIPTADGEDVVRIPLKGASEAKLPSDYLGQYEEPVTFDEMQGRFMGANPEMDVRLRQGLGTKQDLAKMEQWFDQQIQNPAQITELADSLILEIGGEADLAAMGIKDKTGDGLTKDDLDLDGSGVPGDSPEEKKIMRELFKTVMSGTYDKEQLWEKNDNSEFEAVQVDTYNAFNAVHASGGNLNSLLRLPNVFDIQVQADKGQAVIFMGDNRDEKNAFIVPVDENGNVTPEGFDKLADKFKLVDINPNKDGDNIEDDEEVVETPTVEETDAENVDSTVLGEDQEVQTQRDLYQEEATGQAPIAINNSNFKDIKGVSQDMHNKVINALVGIRINKDNLPKIKEVIKGLKGKQFYNKQRNAIMEHIERLIKEGS